MKTVNSNNSWKKWNLISPTKQPTIRQNDSFVILESYQSSIRYRSMQHVLQSKHIETLTPIRPDSKFAPGQWEISLQSKCRPSLAERKSRISPVYPIQIYWKVGTTAMVFVNTKRQIIYRNIFMQTKGTPICCLQSMNNQRHLQLVW